MFSESEWMYERQKLYTLIEEHPDWSLRGYARALQHDLRWVRKWIKRFQERVQSGLDLFRSQSRAPKHNPKRIVEGPKDRICQWRVSLTERFFRAAGAETIQYFMKKAGTPVPCASTIYKTLHERQYLWPRRKVKPVPLELPEVMAEWEMDFGEIYLGEAEASSSFFSSWTEVAPGSSTWKGVQAIAPTVR